LGVEKWLVSAVMSMYTGAKTVARTVHGNSSIFEVKAGKHQGSAWSPLLFVTVMEAISREFRVALAWELLYADDLVVIAETEEDLINRLSEWQDNVENRVNTRMWANAQRDGRPAEHRYAPSVQRRKVWLTPTTRCRAVTLPRRETC